jgi:predicted naringenin-chalcone synthase
VSVEVCSAAFYLDDDAGVLISACLFGDGAGAAVLSAKNLSHRRSVEWKAAGSLISVKDRDLLRFESRNGRLRNILSPCVPQVAARHARSVFDEVTASAGIDRAEIKGWILHAGGRDVLNELQQTLTLKPSNISRSSSFWNDLAI